MKGFVPMQRIEIKKSQNLFDVIREEFDKEVFFVEIGVYKGENAKFIISKLEKDNYAVTYYGFDLYEDVIWYPRIKKSNKGIYTHIVLPANEQLMSTKTVYDKLKNFKAKIKLIKGDSQFTIKKYRNEIKNADIFYIDGGHDYASVKSDWISVINIAKKGSIIIFDDCHVPDIKRLIEEIQKNRKIKFKQFFGSRLYFKKDF